MMEQLVEISEVRPRSFHKDIDQVTGRWPGPIYCISMDGGLERSWVFVACLRQTRQEQEADREHGKQCPETNGPRGERSLQAHGRLLLKKSRCSNPTTLMPGWSHLSLGCRKAMIACGTSFPRE